MFRSDSVFMTEQKLKRLELCQQQTFTTPRVRGLSGDWLMAVSVTSRSLHARLLSNFNDFFKDIPVKMLLWPPRPIYQG